MNNLVVDTSAWVEYFSGSEKGRKVEQIISNNTFLLTSGVIILEVAVNDLKQGHDPALHTQAILSMARTIAFDSTLGLKTANLYVTLRKKKEKTSMSDAHIVAIAAVHHAAILTCDFDFSGLPHTTVIR